MLLGAGSAMLSDSRPATRLKTEHFDRDPRWEGFRNRIRPFAPALVTQAFGFSPTGFAGAPGEIGGQVWRSTTPACYADAISPRTLDDTLAASGTLALVKSSGGSGVFFGWFNARRQGFRPVNFLGFRLDGEPEGATLHADYTTGTWKAAGLNTRLAILPDGARHTWTLAYDPDANDGRGAVAFTLDGGGPHVLDLMPGHKAEGAAFDRFGLFNVQIPGGPMTVYFDDVRYDGQAADFAADPGWEGLRNRATFRDPEPEDSQNFGFSLTDFAGGKPGEVGGTFWRTEPELPHDGYYADRVGPLTLDDTLYARGKVAFTRGSSDSGMYLGWFNASARDEPPQNFLGVIVEGPSRVGHYFRLRYGTAGGGAGDSQAGPVIRPDGEPHEWTLLYDPSANGGNGRIRATLDGAPVSLDLEPEHRAQGAAFDRFGLFTMRRGGHHMTIYFDDLTYTAAGPVRLPR
jgi:hypothetical protein